MKDQLLHQELLTRVGKQLVNLHTCTDRQVLAKWRIVGLCQHLLGGSSNGSRDAVLAALERFADGGLSDDVYAEIRLARSALAQYDQARFDSVLPTISMSKREQVLTRLAGFEADVRADPTQALSKMNEIRERLDSLPSGVLASGLRHRLELVADILAGESDTDRCPRAAAAILYVREMYDATPDDLGQIGLLDDDFALRIVLEDLGEDHAFGSVMHWSETISSIWDDLPFLQGVDLTRNDLPVSTNWLDRLFSFALYNRTLSGQNTLTICTQPSIACSLLHPIISLIGVIVLDALTSPKDLVRSLEVGHVYAVDGSVFVRFGGVAKSGDQPGWLKLEVGKGRDNCTFILPPTLAGRMVAVPEHILSSSRVLNAKIDTRGDEPIQRFFAWREAIGAGSVSSRIVLVTSRERAQQVFGGISSNGVDLLDSGLITFVGLSLDTDVLGRGLVLVVPNLGVARQIAERGVSISSILVDGFERLERGRYHLPFVRMAIGAVPIILWSTVGYYPERTSTWMPELIKLGVSQSGLKKILRLDASNLGRESEVCLLSLRQAAAGPTLECESVSVDPEEDRLSSALGNFRRVVNHTPDLPDYWMYHLHSSAAALRALVSCTPAYWTDIRNTARDWQEAFAEQWSRLRSGAVKRFRPIAEALEEVYSALDQISALRNSKAEAIVRLSEYSRPRSTELVSLRPEQQNVATSFIRQADLTDIAPVLLRDLEVLGSCIVCGWLNRSFAYRLWAHTPKSLLAVVDEVEKRKWLRAKSRYSLGDDDSLLEAVGCEPIQVSVIDDITAPVREEWKQPMPKTTREVDHELEILPRKCVFIWLSDESEGKVLPRNSRVIVEQAGAACEKPAYLLLPEDRVILGPGATRWSPAEEFTQALVTAVERSQPDLVEKSKEWRRLLSWIRTEQAWTTDELQTELARLGVLRQPQTIDGWLRLDRAHPIGPQHLSRELEAIWNLVGGLTSHSLDSVMDACSRLRSLRRRAGLALLRIWMGRAASIGVDDGVLSTLVAQLRQEVQVYEVESISFGSVPPLMLWWWVPSHLAERYEFDSSVSTHQDLRIGEDESGDEDTF